MNRSRSRRLLHEIRHVRVYLAAMGFLAAMIGLLIVAQTALLTRIIDGVFLNGQTLSQGVSFMLLLLAAIAGRALLIWGNSVVAARAASRVKSSLRGRLLAHLQALGPIAIKNERSGELTTTIVEGVEALDAFFSQLVPQVCATLLIPLIIGLAVFSTDLLSSLILLITTPLLLFFLFLIGTLAEAHTKKQWGQLGAMSAHFLDVLQGLTTLKAFGRSQRQQEIIARVSDRFRATTMNVLRVAFLSSLVLEFGTTLSTALVAVEIGLRLLYSHISFPAAFFVLLLVPDFYLPLRMLGTKFHAAMKSAASAGRIYELLDAPTPDHASPLDAPTPDHAPPVGSRAILLRLRPPTKRNKIARLPTGREIMVPIADRKAPSIHLDHVSYTYYEKDGEEHRVLHDVSITLEAGQKIALVGTSGAGKSTIAHLLLRFIEPQQGSILVGTTPLDTLPAHTWRQQIAWVPQRPYLFHGSIADNIRVGCESATMDQIQQAVQKAHLHDFIQSLPYGYEMMVGEHGARLSGGQARRLALARAFLKDAPLFILDEATAHLDRETEEAVLNALHTLLQGRTTLIIAHRLHTLYEVDRVIMLEKGRVIAAGPHETLLAQSPAYQRMLGAYQRKEALWTVPSGVC